MIVRPASSVVFFFVSPEMALKDGCASATSASGSVHLCSVGRKKSIKKILRSFTSDLNQAAFVSAGKQETCSLVS